METNTNHYFGSFRAKLSKYGDRLLEAIESTIKEYYKTNKNSNSSNDSSDSAKRRRDANRVGSTTMEDDDDFTSSTGNSNKRAAKIQNKNADVYSSTLPNYCNEDLDDEPDFYDWDYAVDHDEKGRGRVLPSWSTGNK